MDESEDFNVLVQEILEESDSRSSAIESRFPLWAILALYETSSREDTYIDYMDGFKLLVSWLAPFDIPSNYQIESIPKIIGSYEMNEVANVLQVHPSIIYQAWVDYSRTMKDLQELRKYHEHAEYRSRYSRMSRGQS